MKDQTKLSLKSFLGELVTLTLLAAAVVLASPAFAWAAVGSLLVSLVADSVHEKLFAMKNINVVIPDDFRKRLSDNEAAVASIIYNAKQRGF